ncbi:MAG: phytoene/squalene synthase family protein [Hyphomicrobium sp.]
MQKTWSEPTEMRDADQQVCRALLRTGSRSFYAASFLLPEHVRAPACALYAFCRVADDAIDVSDGDAAAVADLRARIDAAYRGAPRAIAYDRALAATVAKFAIPRAVPEALIEGFAWDIAQRRYETLDDLLGYAARVAGTVGAMMCLLMGRREASTVARATDLGMAMQLTNIARDVGEDARAGRLYLPMQWCREEGLDIVQWMKDPVFCPAIARCVARLLEAADALYASGERGITELPRDCRRGIRAAGLLYANIGHEVARRGYDSVTSRAVVSGRRKLGILTEALSTATSAQSTESYVLSDASRFLVDAVTLSPIRHATPQHAEKFRWWNLHEQGVHIIHLLENIERRQREATSQRAGFNAYAGEPQSS